MSVAGLSRERATRLVTFGAVGAVGMTVDLAITFALLGAIHPLAANAVGFAVAVTHNFAGNWAVTFDRPDGSIRRQYASYVGLHSVTFGVRAIVLSVVLATTALPATVASVVGVGAAVVINFLGSERIFEHGPADTLNRVAHRVFDSRVRAALVATGVYPVVFHAYARVLAALSPGPTETVAVGDASATLRAITPTETVSVMHTLENERPVLRRFVRDIDPGDHVVDVGANLGVYSALALDVGADVTAVEAHSPTAERLAANCPDAVVRDCALGAEAGRVALDVSNDTAGTQRPTVDGGGGTVRQLPGDDLPAPDVLKIDVEGAEVGVLDGFCETLRDDPPRVVFVETHGDALRAGVEFRLVASGYDVPTAVSVGADETMLRATHERV